LSLHRQTPRVAPSHGPPPGAPRPPAAAVRRRNVRARRFTRPDPQPAPPPRRRGRKRRVAALVVGLAAILGPAAMGQWAYLQWTRSQALIQVDAGMAAPWWGGERAAVPLPRLTRYFPDSTAAFQRILALVRPGPGPDEGGGALVVPRVFLHRLPSDLARVRDVQQRKAAFVAIVLPLALRENEHLRLERRRFTALQERLAAGRGLSLADHQWMAALYEFYRVAPGETARLLRRVDQVPPSLTIAQAAKETGWGLSRFACEGNALFGIWTWDDETEGMVPREREEGARHRVRAYRTLGEGVRVYMYTLNTHAAYRGFRTARAHIRANGRLPEGAALAREMERYSQNRSAYVASLHTLMEQNDLYALDRARLAGPGQSSLLLERVRESPGAQPLALARLVDRIVSPTSASAPPDPERCS